MTAAAIGALLLSPAGCSKPPPQTDAGTPAPSGAFSDGGPKGLVAHPAVRCSECHTAIYEEWKTSAHARAMSSPLYVAMRQRASDASCDRCHAPLAILLDKDDLAAKEGVNCEACHALRDVVSHGSRAVNVIELDDNVKRGRRCDLKDHYFHKMGCSPLHHRGEVCEGCHHLTEHETSGDLGVYTEFDEWKSGPMGKSGVNCQDCHMPGETREIANSAGVRADVSTHGYLGADGDLRSRALSLVVAVGDHEGRLAVTATVKNVRAGHSVPTGMPGRQVVLRVRTVDDASEELDRFESVYGRVLVDGAGHEVPFYAAKSERSDTRIAPGASKVETFELAAGSSPKGGSLIAELVWRSVSPAVASSLGVAPDELVLATVRLPFGAARPHRGRAQLPANGKAGGQ